MDFTSMKATFVAVLLSVSFAPMAGATHLAPPFSKAFPRDFELPAGSMSFWIGDTGPTGPIFTAPPQFPSICQTFEPQLGQPLIDNQHGIANAVYPGAGDSHSAIVAYSKKCTIRRR